MYIASLFFHFFSNQPPVPEELYVFETCPRVRLPVTSSSSSSSLIRPDLVCYNCAVKACGSSGEFEQALGVMDVRREELLSASVFILQ